MAFNEEERRALDLGTNAQVALVAAGRTVDGNEMTRAMRELVLLRRERLLYGQAIDRLRQIMSTRRERDRVLTELEATLTRLREDLARSPIDFLEG